MPVLKTISPNDVAAGCTACTDCTVSHLAVAPDCAGRCTDCAVCTAPNAVPRCRPAVLKHENCSLPAQLAPFRDCGAALRRSAVRSPMIER